MGLKIGMKESRQLRIENPAINATEHADRYWYDCCQSRFIDYITDDLDSAQDGRIKNRHLGPFIKFEGLDSDSHHLYWEGAILVGVNQESVSSVAMQYCVVLHGNNGQQAANRYGMQNVNGQQVGSRLHYRIWRFKVRVRMDPSRVLECKYILKFTMITEVDSFMHKFWITSADDKHWSIMTMLPSASDLLDVINSHKPVLLLLPSYLISSFDCHSIKMLQGYKRLFSGVPFTFLVRYVAHSRNPRI
jgi:hypothetical protein